MSSPIFAAYYIPGLNVAFIFSLVLTIGMTLAIIPYAKRRPVGKPLTWVEAMLGSMYVFGAALPGLRRGAPPVDHPRRQRAGLAAATSC